MNPANSRNRMFGKGPGLRRFWAGPLALALILGGVLVVHSQQTPRRAANSLPPISASEFSRMIQEFSEKGGYFQSDNFTSNETAYLHILGRLKELGVSGGAYVGVGPEQNFTYIAKIRPQIAFIVYIRRQAIIQHLLYKSLFHLARNRVQFLSLLLRKPLPTGAAAKEGALDQR